LSYLILLIVTINIKKVLIKRDIHLRIETHFAIISSKLYCENSEQAEKPCVTPRKQKHDRSPELPSHLNARINSYFIAGCIIYASFQDILDGAF